MLDDVDNVVCVRVAVREKEQENKNIIIKEREMLLYHGRAYYNVYIWDKNINLSNKHG